MFKLNENGYSLELIRELPLFPEIDHSKKPEYYVYVYCDPRIEKDYFWENYQFIHPPFYIGKGKGNRIKTHIVEAKKSLETTYKLNKIRKILKETDYKIFSIKLIINLYEEEALYFESEIINYFWKDNILTNVVNNEGAINHYRYGKTYEELYGKERADKLKKNHSEKMKGKIISEETKQKISKIKKGKKNPGVSEYNKNRTITNEMKQKISKANKGKSAWNKGLTKETDSRVSSYSDSLSKSKKNNPNISGENHWNYGKTHSEETKKKISETLKNKGATNE